ncbi:MAG: DUF4276 family protein [Mariprofundus sp.]|nr:DUF4276 family protein [Mariprofundus sp.]
MAQAIGIATEDALSEAVVEKMLNYAPIEFNVVLKQRKRGSGYLKKQVRKFNAIANSYPVLLLTDLDRVVCASELKKSWLTIPQNPKFLFRVAVREVESWLLADREAISQFLNISISICPGSPDDILDPKQALINLAKKSKRREIKQDMLPAKGSLSPVGLGYNARLSDFVWNYWNVDRAIVRSDSLNRAWKSVCALK